MSGLTQAQLAQLADIVDEAAIKHMPSGYPVNSHAYKGAVAGHYALKSLANILRQHPREAAVCIDCGENPADYPSELCPGCEAYREHTGAI